MPKTAVVILAEGFEEIEAIGPVDVLRRAGVRAILAGVDGLTVKSSRGVPVLAEILLKDVKGLPDAAIVPGGLPGATHLAKSAVVGEFLKKMNSDKRLIAAICAARPPCFLRLVFWTGKRRRAIPAARRILPRGSGIPRTVSWLMGISSQARGRAPRSSSRSPSRRRSRARKWPVRCARRCSSALDANDGLRDRAKIPFERPCRGSSRSEGAWREKDRFRTGNERIL